ncbi:MAG: hypothetical protein ACP5H7_00090 [Minisyncoccia bacterium]
MNFKIKNFFDIDKIKLILKNKKIIILFLILILLFIFGFLLNKRVFNPSWNPFNLLAKKRIYQGVLNLFEEKLKDYNADVALNFRTKSQDQEGLNLNFSVSGSIDNTDPTNEKIVSNIKAWTKILGIEIPIKIKSLFINNDLYFYVTDIPNLSFFNTSSLGLIKNQWVKVPLKEKVSQKNFFSEELKKLLTQKDIFTIKKELKSEKVAETNCYHYIVTLNPQSLKSFIIDILKEAKNSQTEISETKFQEIIDNVSNNFEKNFQKIGDIDVEIWISKRDKILEKMIFEKEIDLSQFGPKLENEPVFLKIDLSSFFQKRNEKLDIEPPTQYKLFQEIKQIEELQKNQ